jgi:predicted small lipoprotein YifL
MFRTCRHIFFLTVTAVLLNACGLKGPLYLPEERAQREAQQQAEREQEKKNRQSPSNDSATAPVIPTDSTPQPSPTTSPPGN